MKPCLGYLIGHSSHTHTHTHYSVWVYSTPHYVHQTIQTSKQFHLVKCLMDMHTCIASERLAWYEYCMYLLHALTNYKDLNEAEVLMSDLSVSHLNVPDLAWLLHGNMKNSTTMVWHTLYVSITKPSVLRCVIHLKNSVLLTLILQQSEKCTTKELPS